MATPKKNATPDTSSDGDLAQPPVAADPPADTPVTMADAAALNGVDVQPDEAQPFDIDAIGGTLVAPVDMDALETAAKPFISAGMASDLDQQGWCIDPVTGKKIVRDGA